MNIYIKDITKTLLIFSTIFVALILTIMLLPKISVAEESVQCAFTKDLEEGIEDEDVRCLQKFLNSKGFKVSDSGVGSPGSETNQFREKTREAVKRWQIANGISPATGYFGTISKKKYYESIIPKELAAFINGGSTTVVPTTVTPPATEVTVPPVSVNTLEKDARKAIKSTFKAIEDAREKAEDRQDEGKDIGDALNELESAENKLDDAKDAFLIDEDYAEAKKFAERAVRFVENALDEAGVADEEDDAQEAIDDAKDAIKDAKEEISDADDDGDDVNDAEDTLDRAENKLDDAQEAFDDGDFEDAITLAKRAEILAEDSIDAIGN